VRWRSGVIQDHVSQRGQHFSTAPVTSPLVSSTSGSANTKTSISVLHFGQENVRSADMDRS